MERKFRFRGWDKPVIEGKENNSFFGEGKFTAGKVYPVVEMDEDYPNVWMWCNDVCVLAYPNALFVDDNGNDLWEELIYFDEV